MTARFPAPQARLANLRDLASADPRLVPGRVWRSDTPLAHDEPPPDLTWPPRIVIDLRDASELVGAHPLAGSTRVERRPLMTEAAMRSLRGGEVITLPDLYARMAAPERAALLTGVVDLVAHGETPVLVHCSAGKDRTGVAVALMLALVGVERERIVLDYLKTAANMPAVTARFVPQLPWPQRLLGRPGFARAFAELERMHAGEPPGKSAAITHAAVMIDTPPDAIAAVLDVWQAHPGGAEGWYLDHGGSSAALARLRAMLRR